MHLQRLTIHMIHLNSSLNGSCSTKKKDIIQLLTLDQLSDEENNQEVERAIDEILRYDFQNIYRKVSRKLETNDRDEKVS